MKTRRPSKSKKQKRRSLFEQLESRQLLCSIADPSWEWQRTEGNDLVANSDSFSMWHDSKDHWLPVLYNDYDYYSGYYYYGNGPSLHTGLQVVGAIPSLGTTEIIDGELFFTPPAQFAGFVHIEYTISNGIETLSSFAVVEVVNDPVIARNDPGFYHENSKGGRWSSGSNYHASWGDYGDFTGDPTITSDYNYTFTGWDGGARSWSRSENQIVLNRNGNGDFVFDVTANDIDLDLLTATPITAFPAVGAVPDAGIPAPFDPLQPGRLAFRHNNAPVGEYEILYEATDGISASTAVVKIRVVDGPVGGASGWTESTGTGGSSGYDMTADEGRLFDENFRFESEVAFQYDRGYAYNSEDLVVDTAANTITDSFGNVFHRNHGSDQYFIQGAYVTENGAANVGAVMSIGYGNTVNGETHVVYTYDLAAFDPVTLTIDWGDGQTSQSVVEFQITSIYLPSQRFVNPISYYCGSSGSASSVSPGELRILGTTNLKHVYETVGNYTITANHPTYSIQKSISVEESWLDLNLDFYPSLIAGISNDVGEFRDTNLIDDPNDYAATATWNLPNYATATSDVTLVRTTTAISDLLLYSSQNQPNSSRFQVLLDTPAGVGEGNYTVTVTITDKENEVVTEQTQVYVNVLPTDVRIIATDPSATESADPNADTGQFTISLSHPQTTDTTVSYDVTGTADAGTDYVDAIPNSVVIAAGDTQVMIDIIAVDDQATGLVETDETVAISLTGTSDPSVQIVSSAQSAIVTIHDDDSATLSISATDTDASETLPTDAANPGVFTLSLSSPSSTATSVTYTVQTASEPNEYVALPATLVIPAGQTSADFPLHVVDDDLAELGEAFQVSLTSIAAADADISLDPANLSASLIIEDNDSAAASITAISNASETGSVPGTFLVELSNPTVASTTISYSVTGDVNGSDYSSISQIQIPAGQQSVVLEMIPVDDDLIEGHEDLTVELTAVVVGLAGTVIDTTRNQATVQIQDNDLGIISVNTIDANEEGPVNGQITVSMDRTIDVPVTVSLSVSDVSATSGVDYQALQSPLTITIPANSLEASTVLTVIDDLSYETDETLNVTLTGSDNSLTSISATANTSTLTIIDNDLDQRPLIQFDSNQSLTGLVLQDSKHASLTVNEDFLPDATADLIGYIVGDAQTTTINTTTLPVAFTAVSVSGDTDLFSSDPPVVGTGTGSLRSFTTQPDADKSGVTEVIATVTDSDGNQDSITLTVTVNAVNDVPVITQGTEFFIDENLLPGTLIGTPILATDVEGKTLSDWRFDSDDFGHFAIDAATGQLSVKPGGDIDFDILPAATPYFDLFVSVTDGTAADESDRSAQELVRIHVADLNDTSPVIDAAGPFSVLEGSPVGFVVAGGPGLADLNATDVDTVGAIVAWEIESGDDDGMFAIAANSDPSTATLSVARPDLDFEYAPHTYTLDLVAVDDAGNRSLPQAVIVNVTDDLSEPAEISISDSTGNRLVNNGTFDFGVVNDDLSDPASSSTSQTFTVRNHGNADLTLDPSSNVVPAGFQFSGVTPSNVVAPGATAQFTITFTASAVGTVNDAIEVANDDADDSPFRINALVTVDPANRPPALFTTDELSVAGPVVLGSYLGRLPAYDPDGDFVEFSLTPNAAGDALPDGLISVDPDTGDLYLADIELLPAAGIVGSIAFSVREESTNLTTSGALTLTLPGRKTVLGDDFRDNGSHRDEIIFDLRPTSVAADGQTLYTTLLINDQPQTVGQTISDTVGGYTYGSYHVDEAGFVRYTPNPTLYQDRQAEFVISSDADAVEGITFLDRPEITLALIADNSSRGPANTTSSPSSDVDVLATRTSTPALQNTQPVAIATGEASGLLSPLPIFAQMNDLFSIDLSQWFVDPDGDEIVATSAQRFGAGLNVDTDPTDLGQVFVDIVGVVNQQFRTFSSGTASIYVSDHIDYPAEERLEIQFKEFEDDLPRYETAAGISLIQHTDRNDIDQLGDNDERSLGSDAWRKRWNAWQVESTVHSVATNNSPEFAVGDANIDLATGQAKVLQALNLNDAFDDLSVSLPGLVYDGNNVNNQSLAHLVVHKPADESRDITGFNVTVERYDHFTGAVSVSPTTLNFSMTVDMVDQNAEKFSLVVPVIEDHEDVLDSGIVRYTLRVEPEFDGAGSSIADDPIALTQAGRIVVVKQTTLDPDFTDTTTPFDSASYSDFSPEFGDGWQLAGLPRLILDRGNPKTGVFYDGSGGNFSETAVPHVVIQMPGSDDAAVFRGTSAQPGMPYAIHDSTFTPFDTQFGTDDVRQYGRLSMAPSIDFGGNVSDYVSGMTFAVNGSNDSPGGGFMPVMFEFDDGSGGMGMGDLTVDLSGLTSLKGIRDAVFDALTTPWVLNDLGIVPVKVGTTRIQLGGPTGSSVWKDWAPDDMTISGGNKLSYIDESGTEYLFERFNTEFESRSGEPTPQFLVTEVTPPDGSGIKVQYEDGITGPAIISVNNTGGQNEGPLRIHRITALRDSEDTGSLTFNYVGPTVDTITYGDGRQISLEYTGENLAKVKQPLGVETVFGHTTVGTAADETAKPMLQSIQHQRVTTAPAATIVDDYTEFTYADGAIDSTIRGKDTDLQTISQLKTIHAGRGTATKVQTPTQDILKDDDLFANEVAATVSVSTQADLSTHDGTASVSNPGSHVTEYHLDYRGNTAIVDSLFDPTASDRAITSRSMTQYDAFDNPVLAIDPLGRRTRLVYDYTVTPGASLQGETLHTGAIRENTVVVQDDSGFHQFKREGNQLNAMGRLTESIDVFGRNENYQYDDTGRLEKRTAVRDSGDDQVTETKYTDSGLPSELISPLELKTEFDSFDDTRKRLPKLITYTEPTILIIGGGTIFGRTWTELNTYDSFGYLDTTTTTENGLTVSVEDYEYDELGRLIRFELTDSAGTTLRQESYSYDSLDRKITSIDGLHAENRTVFDTAGRVKETIAATSAGYDAEAVPGNAQIDIQQKTQFQYYSDGSLKKISYPDLVESKFYYQPLGSFGGYEAESSPSTVADTKRYSSEKWTETTGVSSGDDQNGSEIVRTSSDEAGRILSQFNYLTGGFVRYDYHEGWTDQSSSTRRKTQLGLGTSAPGIASRVEVKDSTSHARAGEMFRQQTGASAGQITLYDDLGYINRSSVDAVFGLVESFETDAVGNVTKHTQEVRSENGPDVQIRSTETIYDALSNPRRVTDAKGQVSTIDIAVVAQVSDWDGPGSDTSTSRVLTQSTVNRPDQGETLQQADAAGQLVRSVSAFGGTTVNQYDKEGNVTEINYRETPNTISLTIEGQPVTHNDTLASRTVYTYDDLGRLRQTGRDGDATTAAIDGAGHFTEYADYFLPVDLGGVDTVHINAFGGQTRVTNDSLERPTQILLSDPDTAVPIADGIQSEQTFRYDYDSDVATLLVTSVLTDAAGTVTEGTRSNKKLYNDIGLLIAQGNVFPSTTQTNQTSNWQDALDDPLGRVNLHTRNQYNHLLQLELSYDANSRETEYTHDFLAGTSLVTIHEDVNGLRKSVYNSLGEVIASSDRTGNQIERQYDQLGRLVQEGSVVSAGPNGSPGNRVRTWDYDADNAVTYKDGDDNSSTTTIDFANQTQTTVYNDLTTTTYLGGDGRTLVVHSQTPGTEFANGDSYLLIGYDDLARSISETHVHETAQFNVPSVQVNSTYAGSAMDSRSLLIADDGDATGFQAVVNSNFTIDAAGRIAGISQSFAGPWSYWATNTQPAAYSASMSFGIDGKVAEVTRYADASFTNPRYVSTMDYRDDGILERVDHKLGDEMVASHEMLRRMDGVLSFGAARVYGNDGDLFDDADGNVVGLADVNFGHSGTSGANVTSSVPIGNEDLLPGFQSVNADGQNTLPNQEASKGNRRRSATLPGHSDATIFVYSLEGRLVETRRTNTITTPNPNGGTQTTYVYRTEYDYDAMGRLLKQADLRSVNGAAATTLASTEYAYDALGTVIATKHTEGGSTTVSGSYGNGATPELIFDAASGSPEIQYHIGQNPIDGSVLAIVGTSIGDRPVWTLADTGGSVRTYATTTTNGIQDRVMHANYHASGRVLSTLVESIPGNSELSSDLPRIFAGNYLENTTGNYRTALGWYDPQAATLLVGASGSQGIDSYTLPTAYPDVQATAVDFSDGVAESQTATHLALELAGLYPGYGIPFDIANGILYSAEGNFRDAGLSFGAAVPAAGYLFNAARVATRAGDAVTTANGIYRASRAADITHNVIESVDAIAQGVGAVRSDPNSGFGYFQIGIGAFGIGVNTTAIARSISRIDAFAPNRGTMTGGIYRTGRGEFVDIDRAGTAIRNLSTSKIKVTDRGIGVVENHLSRFGNWGHNNAMLKRLRDISSGKAKPTQIDLDFYAHELRESVRLRQLGNATGEVSRPLYLKAHNAALREYGIPFGAEESRLYTDFARQFLFFAE